MGYEIEMFVGEVWPGFNHEERLVWSDLGRVTLCKPGYESAIYKSSIGAQQKYKIGGEGTTVSIYADDGNTRIVKDRYDRPLLALNIEYVIEALVMDVESGYPRFIMALELLKTTQQFYPDAKVVLFGY